MSKSSWKLFSLCCQYDANGKTDGKIRELLANPLDWDYIIKKSLADGILPFVYNRIKTNYDILPEETRNRLEKAYLKDTAYKTYLICEAGKVLNSLNNASIPVLALKGIALAETIYSGTVSRSMGDIDILVRKKDLDTAKEKLLKLGYNFHSTNQGNHITLIKKDNWNIRLEVHWDIVNRINPLQRYAFKINTDEIWENAAPITVAGEKTLGMYPEDLIIYLSCHLLRDYYASFKWFIDIDRITRYYGERLDWEKLISTAKRYKISKLVYYAFYFVNNFLDGVVPMEVMEKLKPKGFYRLEKYIFEKIVENPCSIIYCIFFYFSCIHGPLDKVKTIVKTILYGFKRLTKSNFVSSNGRLFDTMKTYSLRG